MKGAHTMSAPIRWPAEAVWEAVSPLLAGFTVEVVSEIDSTNTELMRRARAGQLDPVLLVAEHQTAGRGRLGRQWCSGSIEPGGARLGLSIVDSLHPDLQLKWPNDVWWQSRKLAGILIETASLGDVRFAVVGVGINIAPRDGQGLSTPPASLSELLPGIDAPATLLRVAQPLVRAIQRFEIHGFAALRTAFHGRDLLYGQTVRCSDGLTGVARGVDASGALLVHSENGVKAITSAEVSVRPDLLAKPI